MNGLQQFAIVGTENEFAILVGNVRGRDLAQFSAEGSRWQMAAEDDALRAEFPDGHFHESGRGIESAGLHQNVGRLPDCSYSTLPFASGMAHTNFCCGCRAASSASSAGVDSPSLCFPPVLNHVCCMITALSSRNARHETVEVPMIARQRAGPPPGK